MLRDFVQEFISEHKLKPAEPAADVASLMKIMEERHLPDNTAFAGALQPRLKGESKQHASQDEVPAQQTAQTSQEEETAAPVFTVVSKCALKKWIFRFEK